jgi:hypothetical protein
MDLTMVLTSLLLFCWDPATKGRRCRELLQLLFQLLLLQRAGLRQRSSTSWQKDCREPTQQKYISVFTIKIKKKKYHKC